MNTRWNILEYLDCEEAFEIYLDEAKTFGDEEFYKQCLADVEAARMLTAISEEINFDRKNLCQCYSFNPQIVTDITNALREGRRHEGMTNRGVSSFHPVFQ